MNKYLIINADDFGISDSVNRAIISLLSKDKISSASLMPNVSFYDDAAKWGAMNPDKVGLHLSLVNDDSKIKHRSISRRRTLENEHGFLFEDMNYFRENAKRKDLKQEIKLQFEKLKNSGIRISHVDAHRYAIYPTYSPILYMYLCKLCKKFNKVPMRWSRNGGYPIGEGIPNLCDSDNVAKFFASVSDFYGIPIPDYVFKFPYRNKFVNYEEKKAAFINMISNLPSGISEVHIHPAIETEELKGINPTWEERVQEYKLMLDDDILKAIDNAQVQVITYSDIIKVNTSRPSKVRALYNILYYCIRYIIKGVIRVN
jgi:predicted glycoside hydrolase/deacetylase ChbG (UPF0249 family)